MPAEPEFSAHAALVAGEGNVAACIAEALAGCGCHVLLATPVGISAADGIDCVAFDGLDEAEWRQVMHRAGKSGRRFGIMVNARLGAKRASLQDLTAEQFRTWNRHVLHAAFLGVRYATEAMRAHGSGGSIINVIGVDGRMPASGASASASSDGGIRMLTKAAALELGPEGIRVNAIQCDVSSNPPRADMQDMARAAVFLASGRSRFMTGADLLIDGGRLSGA